MTNIKHDKQIITISNKAQLSKGHLVNLTLGAQSFAVQFTQT